MRILTTEDVLVIHNILIEMTGGSIELRDGGSLDSSVNSIYQTFGGEELYPTIEEKAARLCFSLIKNHPFVDGNKRTGVQSMITFLMLNDIKVECSDSDIYNIAISVAISQFTFEHILRWIYDHT